MSEKALKPDIRFGQFGEDWEQTELGKTLSLLKDGTHGTHADVDDGPLLLSAKNIKDGEISWDESDRRISQSDFDQIHANFALQQGDVLLTIVGSIGEAAIMADDRNITFQRSVAFLRPGNDITPTFLYSEIQTSGFKDELESRKASSVQSGIYLGELAKVPLSIPSDKKEQKQIGDCFKSLDRLILLEQKKLDDLKNTKSAMLVKMFPKEGEGVPEVRFEGFDGEWVERPFSEIAKRRSEMSSTTDLPQVEYEDVVSSEGRLNKDLREKESRKTGILFYEGDILYGKLRPYLNNWLLPDFTGIAVGDWWVLTPIDADSTFLYYLMQNRKFQSVANVSTGSKMPRADWKLIRETGFCIPQSIEEQRLVGGVLRNIDRLIALHQRKLDKLKDTKKAMLNKMFCN